MATSHRRGASPVRDATRSCLRRPARRRGPDATPDQTLGGAWRHRRRRSRRLPIGESSISTNSDAALPSASPVRTCRSPGRPPVGSGTSGACLATNRIHVFAPPASNPAIAPWVSTYRTAAIHEHDVVQRPDGIRVTSRARTAFDLARWLGPDDLLSVIEQAMRTTARLDRARSRRGRGRLAVAATSVGERCTSASSPADSTAAPPNRIRRCGSARPSSDVVIVGISPPAPDRASGLRRGVRSISRCRGCGWAIEIDVHPTHDETVGAMSDRRRDRAASVDRVACAPRASDRLRRVVRSLGVGSRRSLPPARSESRGDERDERTA